MRFHALALLATLLPATLQAQTELSPKQADSALARWFPVACAAESTADSQMTLAMVCPPKNDPKGAPLLIGAATLDAGVLATQIGVAESAATKPKSKHRRRGWDAVLEKRMALQEQSPHGRLGFYGAHQGLTESALSFIVVDPTTRRSLQLIYTYRMPTTDMAIDAKASAKTMDEIFEKLKNASFALEKRYWHN